MRISYYVPLFCPHPSSSISITHPCSALQKEIPQINLKQKKTTQPTSLLCHFFLTVYYLFIFSRGIGSFGVSHSTISLCPINSTHKGSLQGIIDLVQSLWPLAYHCYGEGVSMLFSHCHILHLDYNKLTLWYYKQTLMKYFPLKGFLSPWCVFTAIEKDIRK